MAPTQAVPRGAWWPPGLRGALPGRWPRSWPASNLWVNPRSGRPPTLGGRRQAAKGWGTFAPAPARGPGPGCPGSGCSRPSLSGAQPRGTFQNSGLLPARCARGGPSLQLPASPRPCRSPHLLSPVPVRGYGPRLAARQGRRLPHPRTWRALHAHGAQVFLFSFLLIKKPSMPQPRTSSPRPMSGRAFPHAAKGAPQRRRGTATVS